ncbi:MAG TPA: hypothetical protein RMH85_10055 [Polyangiaceae bacterium LLY-WYZ-15_(1-7)]|nr:hypothetical protein [Myxococcales bacterium]MAT24672.1 hypothetical protein [Sandaracinus sp.]HJL06352.1 hypothetical protein [Polyangiaceae bacterium LLY-WYZ-15_(1-7)]MBJ72539.1 hypothetical protein [Sandaracinus sp.]HJL08833.1 hypothetical protein [Polyangiaceae bacterium LLY-WYZ-15_(1-7)]
MPHRPPLLLVLSLALAACGSCGGCGEEALVEGPHPYVRCALAEPPEEPFEAGGLSFTPDERVLRVEGAERVWAFSAGPGAAEALADAPDAPLLVLGGFAPDAETAAAFFEAVGERVALLLPGGEDDPEALSEALDEAESPNLVDLRGVRRLDLGGASFLVLPGAPEGRYALGEARCGYGEDDLEALRDAADDVEGGLLSWAAPRGAGPGPDLGHGGVNAGDPALGALVEELGLRGGVHAFPRTQAGRAFLDGAPASPGAAGALAVALPTAGLPDVRADGSRTRASGLLLELAEGGLRVASP